MYYPINTCADNRAGCLLEYPYRSRHGPCLFPKATSLGRGFREDFSFDSLEGLFALDISSAFLSLMRRDYSDVRSLDESIIRIWSRGVKRQELLR